MRTHVRIWVKRADRSVDAVHMGELSAWNAAKVASHPMRPAILSVMDGEPRSPGWIADQLGEDLNAVGYHVRTLAKLGAIELTGTRPVRGVLQHLYRARYKVRIKGEPADRDAAKALSSPVRAAILGALHGGSRSSASLADELIICRSQVRILAGPPKSSA
jgi:DNA-binding transcriptional ArsR family regulator